MCCLNFIDVLTIGRSCSLRNSGRLSLRRSLRKMSRVMMTAVMMKADTRPARRGSSVGDSWTIVAGTKTQEIKHAGHPPLKILLWLNVVQIVELQLLKRSFKAVTGAKNRHYSSMLSLSVHVAQDRNVKHRTVMLSLPVLELSVEYSHL